MFDIYPEDEYRLFAAPVIETVQSPTVPPLASQANPRRVAIVFASYGMAAADYFRLSPVGSPALNGCIVLTTQSPTFAINWKDYGALVQAGWQYTAVGLGFLTFTQILLSTHPAVQGYPDLFKSPTAPDVQRMSPQQPRRLLRSAGRALPPGLLRRLRQRAPSIFGELE